MNDLHDLVSEIDATARAAALGGALRAEAERTHAVDVSVSSMDSPVGELFLAVTARGLLHVGFAEEDREETMRAIAGRISPRILLAVRATDEARRELDEYFAGRRRAFDVPVDLRLAHGFRRSVLEVLRHIPYGVTQSYAAVARAAGNRSAVRAAASACSHNPLPLVVPCHRVVRSDGTMGGYLGGPEAKRTLLAMEAAA